MRPVESRGATGEQGTGTGSSLAAQDTWDMSGERNFMRETDNSFVQYLRQGLDHSVKQSSHSHGHL